LGRGKTAHAAQDRERPGGVKGGLTGQGKKPRTLNTFLGLASDQDRRRGGGGEQPAQKVHVGGVPRKGRGDLRKALHTAPRENKKGNAGKKTQGKSKKKIQGHHKKTLRR